MANNTSQGKWQEDELENPLGNTKWVFNSLRRELIVRGTLENPDGSFAPWHSLRLNIESVVVLEGVSSICRCAFKYKMEVRAVQIPKTVTSVEDEAFYDCTALKQVTLPDSIETIGYRAFGNCFFPSIKIPKSVVSFGGNPFTDCRKLRVFDISENPNFVFVDGVLMNKEMTQVIYCNHFKTGDYVVPDTVTCICSGAFHGSDKLNSITIPDSVKKIGDNAFCLCWALKSITFTGSVETLGANSFFGCNCLSEIKVVGESQNFKIVDGVLYDKEMTRVIRCLREKSGVYEMPNTVKTLDMEAFVSCSKLISIAISDSVTEIPLGSFCCCSKLETITVPNSVTSIACEAFSYCKSLASIIIPESVSSVGEYAFRDCHNLKTLYLPESLLIPPYSFPLTTKVQRY